MKFQKNVDAIVSEVRGLLERIRSSDIDPVVEQLVRAERVYVAGGGRTGLMARAFAMRLMHLGLTAYVVGETTTPAIRKNDVMLVCSGSGQTQVTVLVSRVAKEIGARIIAITANRDSPIARIADAVVVLDAPYKKALDEGMPSIQYAGSLFEQSLLVLTDAIALEIGRLLGRGDQEIGERHANLE
jgi:6-phospho-3-hexuloisomerase